MLQNLIYNSDIYTQTSVLKLSLATLLPQVEFNLNKGCNVVCSDCGSPEPVVKAGDDHKTVEVFRLL